MATIEMKTLQLEGDENIYQITDANAARVEHTHNAYALSEHSHNNYFLKDGVVYQATQPTGQFVGQLWLKPV